MVAVDKISSFFKHKKGEIIHAWDITNAYNSIKDYKFSKKTFERKILSSKFLPNYIDKNFTSLTIISHVKEYWDNLAKKKRFTSLNGTLYRLGDSKIIYLQDKRGKRYWIPIHSSPSSEEWLLAIKALSKLVGNNLIIWPNFELYLIFKEILTLYESEQIVLDKHVIVLPCGAFLNPTTFKTEPSVQKKENNNLMIKNNLSHLDLLESESIHLFREVFAEASNPAMLYSMGKDSAVMLHLARKAFYPSKVPFPILHVDTGWKFQEMYEYRNWVQEAFDLDLLVYKNEEGVQKGINPFDHGSKIHTEIMKTEALKQALDLYKFDFIFGGARRDEEKSRAKERVLSFRSRNHIWDPKSQKPELWHLYNCKKMQEESARVFPLSNWTELDIWHYIYREDINIVPLYFSSVRPVVKREDCYLMVDDDRFQLLEGEELEMKEIRFRTLGCYPLTAAIESSAKDLPEILLELIESNTTERSGRLIDQDEDSSMEQKKKEGYF